MSFLYNKSTCCLQSENKLSQSIFVEDVINKGVTPTCQSNVRKKISRVNYIRNSDAFEFVFIRSMLKSPNNITSLLFSLVGCSVRGFKKDQ